MLQSIRQISLTALVALLVGGGIGYWIGNAQGLTQGRLEAQEDLRKVQQAAAQKAAEQVSKAANPFQSVNPLQDIETNPFEKTKQILNPFE